MKRYIKSTSETIPEELSSRPYVFILNSVNSTYNDDILEIAEKWGAIKVKYQQKIADTDKLYREGYWCFAVDEKATAQHIWDEVKAIKIPTHQDSLNIVKTNWDNNYNIWIDDYAAGTKKVKWHEKYPVKSSTDPKASVTKNLTTSGLLDILPDPVARYAQYEPSRDDIWVDQDYNIVLEVLRTQGGYAFVDEYGPYDYTKALLTRGPVSIVLNKYNTEGCIITLN